MESFRIQIIGDRLTDTDPLVIDEIFITATLDEADARAIEACRANPVAIGYRILDSLDMPRRARDMRLPENR
jgi:hypothetical protein